MKEYDYIIVGSGIAGLYTALLAQGQGSVLLLTKAGINECNTRHAQGGIAAAIGIGDSAELHYQDTIAAGAGLCDEEAVRILVDEGPDRITDLVDFGVHFDTADGEVALAREAAHSMPRILHAGGDATGEHIEVTLSRMAMLAKVVIMEYCLVTQIIVNDGVIITLRFPCETNLAVRLGQPLSNNLLGITTFLLGLRNFFRGLISLVFQLVNFLQEIPPLLIQI